MRILVLSHMYPQPGREHYGLFVHESLLALRARGHELQVIVPLPHTPPLLDRALPRWRALAALPPARELAGLSLRHPRYLLWPRRLDFAGAAGRMARAVLALPDLAGYELLHAHGGLPDGAAAARIAARLGLPYVLTSHGSDVLRMSAWSHRAHDELTRGFAGAAALLFPSRAALARAAERGLPTAKGRVLANGHEHARFAAAPLPQPGGPLRVIAVANHYPDKGLDLLLRAAAAARAAGTALSLHIVGRGPESGRLHALAASLELPVRWSPALDRGALAAALAAAEVFALPARGEAFGIAYLEAMAAGLAVIAPAEEGIADLIADGENGRLLPAGAEPVAALAALLGELAADPAARRRLGAAARASAAAYDWAAHAAALEGIYRECLADSAGRAAR